MKIIIVGSGKVGYAIARQVAAEKHDIVMVDDNAHALAKADNTLDVMCVQGNGASISVLMSAGVKTADLVIAVTGFDETNLVCSLIAKKLGAKHTIARVRNPEYRQDAQLLKQEIGLDMVINPDLAAAKEITRIISFPAAFSAEPFAHGRIDMIGFQITAADHLVGKSLGEYHRERPEDVLICAVERNGVYTIPNGTFVPQAGDNVYMIGTRLELLKMLQRMGRPLQKVKNVSIFGGSRIAMYLTWELEKTNPNTQVRIVERNTRKCVLLASQLPHAMIIDGDGTDSDLLAAENVMQADAFVSLTDRDEENLLMAMSARHAGIPKVLAKMTRSNYMDIVRSTNIDSFISPKDIVANQITRYVRALANSEGSTVESLYQMLGGEIEALEFKATTAAGAVLNTCLKDLKLRSNILIAAIARDDEILIPGGNSRILEGDRVVVVSKAIGLQDLTDILV